MVCKQCGAEVSDSALFCTICGTKIEKTDAGMLASGEASGETPKDAVKDHAFPSQNMEHSVYHAAATIPMVVVSALLALLVFACAITLGALMVMRPENISEAIAKTDVALVLDEIGLSEEISDGIILPQIDDLEIEGVDIDAASINDFLRRKNVREEIGKVADQYLAALAEGDFDFYITAKDVAEFIEAIAPDIQDEFDISLTRDDYDAIEESLSKDRLKEYSTGKLLVQADVGFSAPYVLLSKYPVTIIGILCAMLTADIFLLHRRKVRSAFLFAGIPFILSGLIYIVTGLLFGPFSGLLKSGGLYNITRIAGGFADAMLISGLICFGAGIASLAIFIAARKYSKGPAMQSHDENAVKKWRYAALITNVTAVIVCFVLLVLCMREMPESSERSRYAGSALPFAQSYHPFLSK